CAGLGRRAESPNSRTGCPAFSTVRDERGRDQKQLMGHVRRYLERRRANPDAVKRYFHEPSVRYAAH
ncbi:MAG TPA: hypothetical protein PLD73_17970, partial [Candidatus Hydrogenedentes bacterium]|nr:hypothetical protein [Candidatus Hydrogenedentota bacterium]